MILIEKEGKISLFKSLSAAMVMIPTIKYGTLRNYFSKSKKERLEIGGLKISRTVMPEKSSSSFIDWVFEMLADTDYYEKDIDYDEPEGTINIKLFNRAELSDVNTDNYGSTYLPAEFQIVVSCRFKYYAGTSGSWNAPPQPPVVGKIDGYCELLDKHGNIITWCSIEECRSIYSFVNELI